MKGAIVVGVACLALGILGIQASSSLFSGLMTLGIFLIVYSLIPQREKPRTEAPRTETPAITSNALFKPQIISFCPSCGSRVESHIQQCPSCGEKLGT